VLLAKMNTEVLIENKGTAKNMPVALTLEHVSPVTRLLEKRKQMLEVQKSLDAQKDEYQKKEELFKRREENLRKKDLELQEALVLFNKFLKENEHKRRRADHRANEERKKKDKWEKEILVKKQNLEQLKIKCRKLKQQHKKNEKYQFFLNKVLEQHGNHFEEIPSIINRHGTLEEAFRDLVAKQKESTTRSETLRIEFQEKKKHTYNHILELNNLIATKSKDLEDKAKKATIIEEDNVEEENKQSLCKTKTTNIIMAVENLHNRCRKVVNAVIKHAWRKLSPKEREMMDPMMVKQVETKGKLEVIKDYLVDFSNMVKDIKNENRGLTNQGTMEITTRTHNSNHHGSLKTN